MENKMTICYTQKRGADDNNKYPYKQVVTCLDDLLKATAYDHVCAVYKGNARSGSNFIESTCLVMDCDNAPKKPSDPDIPPEDWKTPEDVADAFPSVDFYIVYSRNNQKQKGNRPPRPKFHVYFPISKISTSEDYAKPKRRIQQYFPAFDSNALDAARFFYGVENPQGEYFEGLFNVDDIIDVLAPATSESGIGTPPVSLPMLFQLTLFRPTEMIPIRRLPTAQVMLQSAAQASANPSMRATATAGFTKLPFLC